MSRLRQCLKVSAETEAVYIGDERGIRWEKRVVIAFQKEGIHKIRWERRKIDLDCPLSIRIRYDIAFRDVSWLEQKIMKPSLDGYFDHFCNKSVLLLVQHWIILQNEKINLSSDIERKWKGSSIGLSVDWI